MSFSVLIVTHDSAPELRLAIDSLRRHVAPAPEIVVVDTGSRDESTRVAREAGVKLVECPENPGYGAANNRGLQEVTHDVTALLNPDIQVLDDGLSRLAARAATERALLAPRLLNRDRSVQDSAHPRPGSLEALVHAVLGRLLPRPLLWRAQPWRSPRERHVGWAVAACLVARTDLLRSLGPFDPEIFLFSEDLDLCLRADAREIPTVYVPDVALEHRGGHSVPAAYDTRARRRREVVGRRLGSRALALDDAAQALTFAVRLLAGRRVRHNRALLGALRRARRGDRAGG